MKQNYSGEKRRKEIMRKKKQEEKRNRRLNKQAETSQAGPSDQGGPAIPSEITEPTLSQDQE